MYLSFLFSHAYPLQKLREYYEAWTQEFRQRFVHAAKFALPPSRRFTREIRSHPLRFFHREQREILAEAANIRERCACLRRTQTGRGESRVGVCGRRHDEELEGEERWYGEAEASGGKYSRFQGNRVMTQFRKDR